MRAPVGRRIWIGKKIFRVLASKIGDFAYFTGLNDLPCQLRRRRADIVECGHVDDVGALGGIGHGPRVLKAGAHRFFAHHRLAEFEGRKGNLAVSILGRGNDDGVHPRIGDQFAPVMRRTSKSEQSRLFRRPFRGGGADHFTPWSQIGLECGSDRIHGDGMDLAHVNHRQ